MSATGSIRLPPQSDVMKNVPEHITALLDRLHRESTEQESRLDRNQFNEGVIADSMRDKFIALDQDKAEFIYTLCRATGAQIVVEAGTSFGVSTIYLALAVAANAAAAGVNHQGRRATVIATEHEPTKAARAREHWRLCGDVVYDTIDLREGDLLETLKDNVDNVDLLLLDIWAPMALPTLKLVLPKLRHGAAVIVDNSLRSAPGYKDLLNFMRGPGSPFMNLTLPFTHGLEMSIYLPH